MKILTHTALAAGLLGMAILAVPSPGGAQQSGVEIWSQNCAKCHMMQPANRYTAEQWESIMMNMAIVAKFTTHETEAVLAFLKGGAKRLAAVEPAAPSTVLLASADARALAGTVTVSDPSEDFLSLCAACHGKIARGDGPAAAVLNPRPTDLADHELQESRTDLEWEDAIRNGIRTMPGFANQLNEQQIRAIVVYIRSLVRESGTR